MLFGFKSKANLRLLALMGLATVLSGCLETQIALQKWARLPGNTDGVQDGGGSTEPGQGGTDPNRDQSVQGALSTISISACQVEGWAYDPDDTAASVTVVFFLDGTSSSGTQLGTAVANLAAPVAPVPGNHGFRFTIPAATCTQAQSSLHTLDAYGRGIFPAALSGVPPLQRLANAPQTFGANTGNNPGGVATFRIENLDTANARTSWAHLSIPFRKGVYTQAQLAATRFHVNGIAGVATPAKYYYNTNGTKHSVKLAFFKWPVSLAAGQVMSGSVTADTTHAPPATFSWDADLNNWRTSRIQQDLEFVARIGGVQYIAHLGAIQPQIRQSNAGTIGVFYPARFYSSSGQLAPGVGLVAWLTFSPDQKHFQITFGIHNSTLNEPIPGDGVAIESFKVVTHAPINMRFIQGQAQGLAAAPVQLAGGAEEWSILNNFNIVDGQYFTYRAVGAYLPSGLQTTEGRNFLAEAKFPLVALTDYSYWRYAEVSPAGPGYMPPIPAVGATIIRSNLSSLCNPAAGALDSWDSGMLLNRFPPGTGDQPDFSSGAHARVVGALMSGSVCPLVSLSTYMPRDGLRGQSVYLETVNGTTDFMSAVNHPGLFFWESKIFNNCSYYNGQPQIFRDRCAMTFSESPNYKRNDWQHMTIDALLQTYYLTGDLYLWDWIRRYQHIIYAGILSDYGLPRVESERGTRAVEALLLALEADPESPVEAMIRNKVQEKIETAFRPAVEAHLLTSNQKVACLGTFRDDVRVPLSVTFPGDDIFIGWQVGFTFEAMAALFRLGINAPSLRWWADRYFDTLQSLLQVDPATQKSVPIAYALLRDPIQANQNPIVVTYYGVGMTWRAGVLVAADAYRDFYGVSPPQSARVDQLAQIVGCSVRGQENTEMTSLNMDWRWLGFKSYETLVCP